MESVVIFEVAAQRFGLPLDRVERVVRIVEITPLPRAPAVVVGVINVRGSVIPVVDVRRRFCLPQRASLLTDQLLVVDTQIRRLALWVDAVHGMVDYREQDFIAADAVVPGMEYLRGIVRLADGLVLIQDLEQLLTLAEEQTLAEAIIDV
jgi:purine-binding chemotaxis protein CheW